MKNFLLVVFSMLVAYVLAPFVFLAATSWLWLPIVFDFNNLSTLWGFIIGLFVSSGTAFIYNKLTN